MRCITDVITDLTIHFIHRKIKILAWGEGSVSLLFLLLPLVRRVRVHAEGMDLLQFILQHVVDHPVARQQLLALELRGNDHALELGSAAITHVTNLTM